MKTFAFSFLNSLSTKSYGMLKNCIVHRTCNLDLHVVNLVCIPSFLFWASSSEKSGIVLQQLWVAIWANNEGDDLI